MNDYETLGTVGEGAYGIVLKCHHKKTKEIVAIKKFKDKDTEDSLIKKVIIRELKGLRSLKHPNIIHLRDAFRQNERLYLVFDFCDKSLLDLQNEHMNEGLPISLIRTLLFQILKAIDFMHDHNSIHRDIKPENILICDKSKVKVCDFGFCRTLGKTSDPLTDYVATRWYRSPELLLTPKYGKSVDMWAIGCVLGEMIDGNPMFPGDDFVDQLCRIYCMFGKFPVEYSEFFYDNPELSKIDYDAFFYDPDDFNPDFLTRNYLPICQNNELIDLLKRMLDLNFRTRMTAKEALYHPFFDSLHMKENTLETKKLIQKQIKIERKTFQNEMKNQQKVEFVNTKVFGKTAYNTVEIKLTKVVSKNENLLANNTTFLPKIHQKLDSKNCNLKFGSQKLTSIINSNFAQQYTGNLYGGSTAK